MGGSSDGQQGMDQFDVVSLYGRHPSKRWERTSVGDMFERMCWSYPDKKAIVASADACGSERFARLTYRAADQLANRIANALIARGLQRGDRVVFFCENSVEAYISKFGIAKAGMVGAPINPRMAPDVQDHLLSTLEPKLAIVDRELWPAAEATFTRHGLTGVMIPIGGLDIPDGWVSFEKFVDDSSIEEPDVEIHGDDIWEILPTSGTTSMPKGVMMSHHCSYIGAYGNALTFSRGLRFESDMRTCSVLPLIYHAPDQTQAFPAFLCGGTLIMGRQATGANFATMVSDERATHLWAGSPQFIEEMIAEIEAKPGRYDITSLTSVVFAWAALDPATADKLKALCGEQVQLVEILGQTEAMPCTRFYPDKWPEIYRASAPAINHTGLPAPILAAGLMDEEGRLIERDTPNVAGEIVYRTPAMTAGYYKNEQATQEAFRGGWFHSGDACIYDENGLFVMVDRYKDVIKSGGENVSTIRVEGVMRGHEAVEKAAVVGLNHPRWGEAVTAFVILAPGKSCSEEELIAYGRARLAGFEAPKAVIFVDEIPTTLGSKVLKYKLREQYRDYFVASETAERK
ncbi:MULTISPECIES: class I adenylate-forming enzyme family protein [unclassified Sphingomonas]|nr:MULTISPECIES: AMP-binding protein [unclassified Sphingomonas]